MPRWNQPKRMILILMGAASLGLAGIAAGCTGVSNGVRWVREAPLPEGWPALTPVGEVEVKDYPATRAAIVTKTPKPDADPAAPDTPGGDTVATDTAGTDTPGEDTAGEDTANTETSAGPARAGGTPRGDMDSMFVTLFKHIKTHEIAMTAPVDMGYRDKPDAEASQEPAMVSMAFLYRHTGQGAPGPDGEVTVTDAPARAYAGIGVRGKYTDRRFAENLATLDAWLAEHADLWVPEGPPRYLGYNSPFIPGFMRYGEVQRPVKPAAR